VLIAAISLFQETAEDVPADSGAVFVVGFLIVGVLAVVAAAQYRKRRG